MRLLALIFILITTYINFGYVYAETSIDAYKSKVNSVISGITDVSLLSNYTTKLNSIEYVVNPLKKDKYTVLKGAIEGQYIKLNNASTINNLESFIQPVAQKAGRIVYINSNYEFTENGKTYRVAPYTIVKVKNDKDFLRTFTKVYDLSNEILMIQNGQYIVSINGYKLHTKYTIDDFIKLSKLYINGDFKDDGLGIKVAGKNGKNYILDTTYYSYATFPKKDFYKEDYSDLGNLSDVVIIDPNDGKTIKLLMKHKLYDFPFNVKTNISNYNTVIANMASDYIHYSSGSEFYKQETFTEIESVTKKLIAGKTTDYDKIKAIYDWLLNNVEYDPLTLSQIQNGTLNLDDILGSGLDINIFSGIGTFKTKYGVCQGYTKLFVYMLSIAGIKDVEIMTGSANNGAQYIAHSWVRIGDRYFDPTFDDTVNSDRYIWFNLPEDLMYANRNYDEGIAWDMVAPDILKEQIINNLISLKNKYNNDDYEIFNFYGI